jgi:hypothetical protein
MGGRRGANTHCDDSVIAGKPEALALTPGRRAGRRTDCPVRAPTARQRVAQNDSALDRQLWRGWPAFLNDS